LISSHSFSAAKTRCWEFENYWFSFYFLAYVSGFAWNLPSFPSRGFTGLSVCWLLSGLVFSFFERNVRCSRKFFCWSSRWAEPPYKRQSNLIIYFQLRAFFELIILCRVHPLEKNSASFILLMTSTGHEGGISACSFSVCSNMTFPLWLSAVLFFSPFPHSVNVLKIVIVLLWSLGWKREEWSHLLASWVVFVISPRSLLSLNIPASHVLQVYVSASSPMKQFCRGESRDL
jgi:hypothetical protein